MAPASAAPVAAITASIPEPTTPKRLKFDATSSSGNIVSYAWDFGDGSSGTGAIVEHTYERSGLYAIVLVVTDDTGETASAPVYFARVVTALPTAAFTALPWSGPAPLTVQFDASSSTDTDGTILSYWWDFGDGSTATGVTASHTYPFAGMYTVQLVVVDDEGWDGRRSDTIAVGGELGPTASFTVTPDNGVGPLLVNVDASSSSDPDGSIATYEWDFGDGATASGVTAAHTYASGAWALKLTVTDDSGAKAAISRALSFGYPNRAPQPSGEEIAVVGTGVRDVLENDTDPDGDELVLVAATTPAHGSVVCRPLGDCLYTASEGYTGPDAFSYTVRDPAGLEGSTTVQVSVTAPAISVSLAARDDEVVTAAGAAVQLAPLDNDTGVGSLTLTQTSPPSHGRASCDVTGRCTYDPDPGFSGSDGFTYDVRDQTAARAPGAVHVVVAPLDVGFHSAASGPKGSVAEGEQAAWAIAAAAAPAGVSEQEIAARPRPTLAADLGGAHGLDAGSMRLALGWSAQPSSRAASDVDASAGPDALLGEAVSKTLPRPAPPVSQGTGGDGHVPILVGSKVYAFFHHAYPTSITCVDRVTNQLCPGYPRSVPVGTSNFPGPGAVFGSRIYVHLLLTRNGAQSASLGLFCWDAAKDRTCGMVIVDRTIDAQRVYNGNVNGSAPVRIGDRMYFAGDTGRLYCVDPATNSACAPTASLPTGFAASPGSYYDIVAHGSRVFVSQLGDSVVACIDVAAGASCAGWSGPRSFPEQISVVNQHDATGEAVGVCAVREGTAFCVRDDDPATVATIHGWPWTNGGETEEAEAGTRTLMGGYPNRGMSCWDWATMARCTGGDFGSDGWLSTDTDGGLLPQAYGAIWDGSCAVGLGDAGLLFSVDPSGSAPCSNLDSGSEPVTIDLRDQRCDGSVGDANWQRVQLDDVDAGELRSATVTIRDAATGAALATRDLVSGALDLSGIDAELHPAVTVQMTASSTAGNPAWVDGIPPRIRLTWHGDPKQLCFTTTTRVACDIELSPLTVTSRIVGSSATSEAQVELVRSPSCTPPPPPPPPPPPAPPPPPPPPPMPPPPPPPPAPLQPPPAPSPTTGLILECSGRSIVLEDVVAGPRRVSLLGIADRRYAGSRVAIVFTATGKTVARPVVAPDGRFSATAPLPSRSMRSTNRARYQARVGAVRSLELKLTRRMQVTSIAARGGRVTIAGRVTQPLARRAADRRITLQRLTTCKDAETLTHFMPRADGSFKIAVDAPARASSAVYRLRTKIRTNARSTKLFETFTLPRALDV